MSWATVLSAALEGLLHPLATPAHVVALAGLALVAGRNNRNSLSVVVVAAFAFGLAAGFGALAWGAGETPAADALLAGAALCGLMAAAGVTPPVALAAPVALASGVALGLDSPPDAIRLGDAMAMLTGTACGAVAALAVMTPTAAVIARWRDGIALRVAGSWIAAVAMMALAVRWGT
jgi:urease accessory protein